MSEALLSSTVNGLQPHFAVGPAVTLAISPQRQIRATNLDIPGRAVVKALQSGAVAYQPAPHHRWHAGARLRMRLIAWANPAVFCGSDDSITTALVGNAASRGQLADAAVKAAAALGLPTSDIVLARLDRLALEAASVERMREHLLEPAKRVVRLLAAHRAADADTRHLLRQTGLLLIAVLSETGTRLREADSASADILLALAEMDDTATVVHACCADLARRYPGLPQMLAGWVSIDGPAGFAAMLAETHAFLMASSMRQTAQSREVANDCLDQIRPVRDPVGGAAASCGREQ